MPSDAKIAANRRNSAKSTGPKSTVGKERSRMNSVKHGLYCNPAHLPGEDQAMHAGLLAEIKEFWQPQGPMEAVLVGQTASLQFEFMRVMRAYDLHRNVEVKRAAISPIHGDDFKRIREAHGESLQGVRRANQDIAEVYATEACNPEIQDLEHALKESVTSPREMGIADSVDRRKGRLMRDLDQAVSSLKQLQAMRQSSAGPMSKKASSAREEPVRAQQKPASPPKSKPAIWQQSFELFAEPQREADRPDATANVCLQQLLERDPKRHADSP